MHTQNFTGECGFKTKTVFLQVLSAKTVFQAKTAHFEYLYALDLHNSSIDLSSNPEQLLETLQYRVERESTPAQVYKRRPTDIRHQSHRFVERINIPTH